MKVNIDTNVFIAIKNKEPEYEYCETIIDSVEEHHLSGVISTIVLAEILVGFYRNDENEEADSFSSSAILNFDIIPVNQDVARQAALIRAQYNLKLPDAIISASSLITGADFLITNDITLQKKLKIQKVSPKEFVEKYLKIDK
ncbi:MAG: type II toxin-antitoxin system VapC family toxin [Promethearchaeota archaeon]|nr:MAG: type II toxin-antitoxin system VapC family toxin [Candidatus Lokiarchaeota archaeon]